jgi:serine phosphatase RsbU (regulator of sigma subunit)
MVLSDGITEAFNAAEEMFGEDRIKNMVCDQGRVASEELLNQILVAVDEWCTGSTAYTDDRTIVIVSCCEE